MGAGRWGNTVRRWGKEVTPEGLGDEVILGETVLNTASATTHVLRQGEAVVRSDWSQAQRFPVLDSLFNMGLRSDIIMPLRFGRGPDPSTGP